MGIALNLSFRLMADNPDQEVGTKGLLTAQANGVSYEFIRNDDSYTIREV